MGIQFNLTPTVLLKEILSVGQHMEAEFLLPHLHVANCISHYHIVQVGKEGQDLRHLISLVGSDVSF